jgi:hypothetical protein
VQAARALAYGLGSVLIGLTLADRGLSDAAVGLVLASLLAGSALVSVLIARYGDRLGRRRCYRLLLVAMAVAGAVFAFTGWLPALILAGLTGAVSTEVVESGPFTSLEQAMLPHAAAVQERTRLFGTYNTVATLAGSRCARHSSCWNSRRGRVDSGSGRMGAVQARTKEQLHEQVAAAVNEHVKRPCRHWLWVDVRKAGAKPDRHPAPDVEQIASDAATWVRMIEPGPHDRPREKWITDDCFEVTVTALATRSCNAQHYSPVANPGPPRLYAP